MQLDNVRVDVTYEGSDGPDGQERPMAAALARQGAETVAHDIVGWLSACADCRS